MRRKALEHGRCLFQTAILWLIITAAVFPFGRFHTNELDRLPHALQSYNPNWLPHDWYLNLRANPYQVFDALLGPLVSAFGFHLGVVVGRLCVYLLLAVALGHLMCSLKLWTTLGLAAAFVFFLHQSLVAGEWIAGGVEAKTIAYACVLLSLSYALRQQLKLTCIFAGLAISLHLLVGGFSLFCLILAGLREYRFPRKDWLSLRPALGWLFLTGSFGWWHLCQRLLLRDDADRLFAGLVYVVGRNPHHLLPAAWAPGFWWAYLAMALLVFLVLAWRGPSARNRFLLTYGAGSILLFGFGLLLFACRLIPFLKYYWFRLADVMVPFLSLLLLVLGVQHTLIYLHPYTVRFVKSGRMHLLIKGLASVIIIAMLAVSAWQIKVPSLRPDGPPLKLLNRHAKPMLTWIAEHTPRESVFLVDPLLWDFYIVARRAMFVSAKHVPHLDSDILEWFERMLLCNGGKQPDHMDIRALLQLHRNFYRLEPSFLRDLAQRYGIHYYLGKSAHPLPFPSIHSVAGYTLYHIDINIDIDDPKVSVNY